MAASSNNMGNSDPAGLPRGDFAADAWFRGRQDNSHMRRAMVVRIQRLLVRRRMVETWSL